MKQFKRIFAATLAMSMLVCMIPFSAVLANEPDYDYVELSVDCPYVAEFDGSDIWFVFTAAEEAEYSFSSFDSNCDPYATLYDSEFNELSYSDDRYDWDFGIFAVLTAGETVYLRVNSYSDGAGCIEVNTYPIVELTLDSYQFVEVSGNSRWFVFTAEESSFYSFRSFDRSGDPYAWLYDSEYNEIMYSDDSSGLDFEITAFLSAGQKVYLCASAYGGYASFCIEVCKERAAEEMAVTNAVSELTLGTSLYPDVVYYPEGCVWEDYTVSSSDPNVARVSSEGAIYAIAAGTATITVTSTQGLTCSFDVTVIEPDRLELGEPVEVYGEGSVDEFVYSFTPDESGCYRFYTDNNSTKYGFKLLDSYTNWYKSAYTVPETGYQAIDVLLEGGVTYYVHIEKFDEELYTKLCVESISAAESITIVPAESGNEITVGQGLYLGYVFNPVGCCQEYVSWSSSDSSVAEVSSDGYVSGYSTGTATITVESENGLTDSIEITVSEPDAIAFGAEYNITEDTVFSFIAEETGYYRIYSYDNSECDPRVLLLDENMWVVNDDDDGGYENNFDLTFYAEAGQRLYIRSSFYYYRDGSEYKLIFNRLVPATEISVACGDTYSAHISENYLFTANFAPENALPEEVWWSSDNETVVSISENGEARFVGIGTATVTVESESGLVATCVVTVENYPAIQEGVNTECIIDEARDSCYFSFTPETNGYYAFYSISDSDTCGSIMYDSGERYEDDDSGEGLNFYISRYMEAGRTYTLEARYLGDRTGSFDVVIEETVVVVGMSVYSFPDKTEYISGVQPTYYDMNGLVLEVSMSDGSTIYWRYGVDDMYIGNQRIYIYCDDIPVNGRVEIICGEHGASFDVTLIDNPVESIEVLSDPIKLIENQNGYWEEHDGETYFYYWMPNMWDVELQINYTDGTHAVVMLETEEHEGYGIYAFHGQFEEPWLKGKENYIIVEYLGAAAQLAVEIIDNPIESIELASGPIELIENSGGYYEDGIFYYYLSLSDVLIKINFTDGTSQTVGVYDGYESYEFGYSNDQYEDPWVMGGDNNVYVSLFEFELTIPVIILENPVDHIEVITAPEEVYYWGDLYYGYFEDTYHFFAAKLDGLTFKVFYKDGSEEILTAAEAAENLTYTECVVSEPSDNVEVEVIYMGHTGSYTVSVLEPEVELVEVVKMPDNVTYAYGYLPDFTGAEFLITYTDGSTETIVANADTMTFVIDIVLGVKVNIAGERCEISIIDIASGSRRFTLQCQATYMSIGTFECVEQEIEDIKLENVTDDGDGMTVKITYANGDTDTLHVDAEFLTRYGEDVISVIASTEKGYIEYAIFTVYEEGEKVSYEVYIFGDIVEVELSDNAAVIRGDVNGDGNVNQTDYLMLKRAVLGTYTLSDAQNAAADVNGDENVNQTDYLMLKRVVLGTYVLQ